MLKHLNSKTVTTVSNVIANVQICYDESAFHIKIHILFLTHQDLLTFPL
jgi:hypothetical protein